WLVMVYISADGLLANFAVESLKQLKRAAGNGVVVVAQVDKDGDIPARKYVFDKSGSLADSKAQILDLPTGGTPDPKNLTEFINHAVGTYGQDKRRALFLWGHGPELLFDEDPAPKAGGSARKPIKKDPGTVPEHLSGLCHCSQYGIQGHHNFRCEAKQDRLRR